MRRTGAAVQFAPPKTNASFRTIPLPMITLQTYAHLMPMDEDRARGLLDAAFAPSAGDYFGNGTHR
jgi:hypothetical protein